ncbi:MAG TPA: hypothetical protein VF777_13505 [Phycisphaerales bacterium]
MRSSRLIALLAVLAGSSTSVAQVINWNNAGGGTWQTQGNWLPVAVPDVSTEFAVIGLPGTYTVTLSGTVNPGRVEVQNPDATLAIANAAALNITDTNVVNHGLIRIGNGMGFNFTPLRFQVNGTLEGSGLVRLDSSTTLDSAYLEAAAGSGLITHKSPHVIAGAGRLYGTIVNESIIRADAPGRLLENRGTLTQVGGGTIQCTTGIFGLGNGGSLTGGSIFGAGTWQASGASAVEAVLVQANGSVLDNSTLRVRGVGIVNNATIEVNNGASFNFTRLRAEVPTTLAGSGAVYLRSNTNLDTAMIDADAGGSFVNEASHAITGSGRIYAPMTNRGVIRGTVHGRALEIRSAVTQEGDGRIVGDNADAALSNGAIVSGGRFGSVGSGRVRANSTSTVSGVENVGVVQVDNNSTLQLLAAGIENNGTLHINDGTGINFTQVRANESTVFGGVGAVVLNASASLDTAYLSAAGDASITNSVDHTIRGTGRIYAPMTNLGTIRADNPAGPLEIRSAIDQAAAGRLVGQNAVLQLANGASISGGFLASLGTGVLRTAGTSRISGVTNEGELEVFNNSVLEIGAGGIINNASIIVNPTQGLNFTQIRAVASTTLGGNGTLYLNATAANPDTAYLTATNDAIITNLAGHTISGNGNVYAPIINSGVLLGSTIDPHAVLRLRGRVTQVNGAVTVDKGDVALQGAELSGGNLYSTLSTGVVRAVGSGSLITNAISFAPLHIDNNASIALADFTNNSVILVNPTAGGNFTFASFPSGTTLLGTGVVRLNASGSLDTAYLSGPGSADTATLSLGQAVIGRGNIFGNFTIQGVVSPGGLADSIDTIGFRNGSVAFAPTATVQLQAIGGDPGQYDVINGNSTLHLAGTAIVRLINYSLTTTCDEIPFIQGPAIVGTFDTVNLDVPPATLGRSWRLWYKSNGVSLRLTCPADYNADCNVDDIDFQSFARWYNILDCSDPTMPGDCPGDLNRDAVVDDQDFQLFVLAYNDVLCP